MILRLILILCFLNLLINAKSNVDYYQIIFYLIIYLSIREFIFYLKDNKKNNRNQIIEGFFNYSKITDMLDNFDKSNIDDILVILLSSIAFFRGIYNFYETFLTSDVETGLKGLQTGNYDQYRVNLSDSIKELRT